MRTLLILALAAAPMAGCATVTRGTTNQVQVQSEPPGAQARTSLNHVCTTPCSLLVPRRAGFSVVFSKPGYQDQTIDVKTQIAGTGAAGFAGNVLVGGVVGMGVDAYTGATLEHVPNPVRAQLAPVARPPEARRERPRRGNRRSRRAAPSS